MKNNALKYILVSIVIAVAIVACENKDGNVTRPYDCWVLRSVLDLKPRMVNIALHENFWVSYSTQTASLYKAWKGKINFDGAVFSSAHGPQPTSEGITYVQEPDGNPWRIRMATGEEVIPTVKFQGYVILDNRITLKYILSYDQSHITILEKPEVTITDSLEVAFERTFHTQNVPTGVLVMLSMNLSSMKSQRDFETDGVFAASTSSQETIDKTTYYSIRGELTLNSNEETSFRMQCHVRPEPPVVEKELALEERILKLMAASDCNTCHNRNVKTVGPAYQEIARRYPNTPRQLVTLTEKVIIGGAGNWGDVPMTPHTDVSRADVTLMVSYILGLDKALEKEEDQLLLVPSFPVVAGPFDYKQHLGKNTIPGVVIKRYRFPAALKNFPEVPDQMEAYQVQTSNAVFTGENRSHPTNVLKRIEGIITIPKATNLVLRLVSEGSARVYLDNRLCIEIKGNTTLVKKDAEMFLRDGSHPFRIDGLFDVGQRLSLQWKLHGTDSFQIVPPDVFSFDRQKVKEVPVSKDVDPVAGDGVPLKGVHPAFDLAQARPSDFQPKVGGMDFLSDGRLVVCTWDSLGSVYILDGVQGEKPEQIKVKRIAYGLAEPLGLSVVNDEIYVLQKQELTKLVDLTGDEIIDEYQTICNGWGVSANFHEFAFGLVYQDGYFYATLATAINPGGASTKPQVPDRGRVVRISKLDGSFELVASGLRTPNGIGLGVDNQIFIADNQGDWLPASKIVHYKPGAWYGSRAVDFAGTQGLQEVLPVVWLPQDEIGNSPSQPVMINVGPYRNQLLHGDVTHRGVKRVFVEKVQGLYQGAVFRFTQGLEAGINRLSWGPDSALYVGGVGSGGNWGHAGKLKFGLQK